MTDTRISNRWTAAVASCPKHMTHGPCAGVAEDGGCEVPDHGRCGFVDVPADESPYHGASAAMTAPAGATPAAGEFLATAARRPVVVIDLPSAPLDARELRACAGALRGCADAVLVGDHGGARVQFAPSYRARLLADEGVPAWLGINCRDRNRVAIEGEIAGCLDAGAAGLHCITGDHPMLGHRPDARPVFDLDSVDVIELAASYNALISAAHAPSAPPRELRLPRLLTKVAAGAQVVFVDHCGGVDAIAHAVHALRATGFTGLVIACVPLVTGAGTASVVESFAGDRLPPGYLAGILSADDPAAAGIAAAIGLSSQLLAVPGVDGINLSGGPGPGEERVVAGQLARIGAELMASMPPRRSSPSVRVQVRTRFQEVAA